MDHLRVIDVSALRAQRSGAAAAVAAVATQIDRACREVGFFVIEGHGIDEALLADLDDAARRFFALPDAIKRDVEMARSGPSWRGWFPVGGELTSGVPDRKEGLYFGAERTGADPRVAAGVPLHGPNPFPTQVPELRDLVLRFIDAMTDLGHDLLRGIAVGLDLEADHFRRGMASDPTVLFRIFHYPMVESADGAWGVAEHTDYGLLTLLRQDATGGLEVRTPDGWIEAAPVPGTFVCNLGDMLERISGGRYRSTPHRVRPPLGGAAVGRLSFPFFFDPNWDAEVPGLDGVYGDYLTAKVARVFPDLFTTVRGATAVRPGSPPGRGNPVRRV
ncbi:MAG TPA: 2-oxoglutarate and iron-dependent oxygenase domain-containing protein [Acidimicrobiales bacterium]|nr:2-oxoglutarate and iron-dependent oxygenase domain-containing protein [Acidimicrobiales bacterium]